MARSTGDMLSPLGVLFARELRIDLSPINSLLGVAISLLGVGLGRAELPAESELGSGLLRAGNSEGMGLLLYSAFCGMTGSVGIKGFSSELELSFKMGANSVLDVSITRGGNSSKSSSSASPCKQIEQDCVTVFL